LNGDLLGEIVPADQAGCVPGQPLPRPPGGEDVGVCTGANLVAPAVGKRVELVGPYVRDVNHGWMEVHPVWSFGPGTGVVPVLPATSPRSTQLPDTRQTPTVTPGSSTPSPRSQETTTPTEAPGRATSTATARPDPTRVPEPQTPTPTPRRT
jgi:hypothetical protein